MICLFGELDMYNKKERTNGELDLPFVLSFL